MFATTRPSGSGAPDPEGLVWRESVPSEHGRSARRPQAGWDFASPVRLTGEADRAALDLAFGVALVMDSLAAMIRYAGRAP